MKHRAFILIIFFVVTLFISVTTNAIETSYKNISEMNLLKSMNSISFEIMNSEKITGGNFLQAIKSENNIEVQKDGLILGPYYGRAIYFNQSDSYNIPLIRGRFFTKQDFDQNKKNIVIGKNLEKEIVTINGQEFIRYEKEDFLVIGVLGHSSRSSNFDDIFFINLDSIMSKNNLKFFNTLWAIQNRNADVEQSFTNIKKNIEKLNENATLTRVYTESSRSFLEEILSNKTFSLTMTLIVVLALILNVVNITNFYIESKRTEIGIRKLIGATNGRISRKILIEYVLLAVSAFLAAQFFYLLIIKLKIASEIFGDAVQLFSIIINFLIILGIGIIVALIPILKSFKLHPSQIIKGS